MTQHRPRGGSALAMARLGRSVRRMERLAKRRWVHGRPFSSSARERLLLVTLGDNVAQSQVQPFHHYADALLRRHGAEVREVPVEAYLRGERTAARGATVVAFQTWFDITATDLDALLTRLKAQHPGARLVYLDWFSPTDLRLAEALERHVSLYVKRHLMRNRSRYRDPTYGHTNLMDHYGRRFGLEHERTFHPVPEGFFDRLLVGPSFVTSDVILRAAASASPPASDRPIDVHARLGTKGSPWYRCMRSESVAALERIADLRLATGAGVHPVEYLRELAASRICFSPFGYGEVCWRDYEAIAHGAVVLKPDMSHVETDPDVFVANETYVPVRWDLADLEDKVRWLVGRPRECRRIAEQAYAVLHDYVRHERFVDQVAPILAEPRSRGAVERVAPFVTQSRPELVSQPALAPRSESRLHEERPPASGAERDVAGSGEAQARARPTRSLRVRRGAVGAEL